MGQEQAALGHFREAMRLYPESPVPYFFLGKVLPWRDDSKATYSRAAQLGDDKVKAAAYKAIRDRGQSIKEAQTQTTSTQIEYSLFGFYAPATNLARAIGCNFGFRVLFVALRAVG
jgi:hypothetical protein